MTARPFHVVPREDVLHEPEFPGDRAVVGVVEWMVLDGDEDWVDGFDTEAEANAAAARLNAAAGALRVRHLLHLAALVLLWGIAGGVAPPM